MSPPLSSTCHPMSLVGIRRTIVPSGVIPVPHVIVVIPSQHIAVVQCAVVRVIVFRESLQRDCYSPMREVTRKYSKDSKMRRRYIGTFKTRKIRNKCSCSCSLEGITHFMHCRIYSLLPELLVIAGYAIIITGFAFVITGVRNRYCRFCVYHRDTFISYLQVLR